VGEQTPARTRRQFYGYALSHGLIGPDTVSLGIYYDDPDATPAERLRSHACLTVPESFSQAPEGFELLELEGGDHAIGLHRGPYERLHESYRWLFGQWLPSSGREPANRPVHEIYVNDPRTTAPADLVTHMHPVAAGCWRSGGFLTEASRRNSRTGMRCARWGRRRPSRRSPSWQ
jgi:AraC family transcriptional regulator